MPQPGLIRALGPLMATAVVVGTVIGSGVFKKPQTVAENVPNLGIAMLVWVAIGLLALIVLPVPFLRSLGYGGMLIPLVSVAVAVTLDSAGRCRLAFH